MKFKLIFPVVVGIVMGQIFAEGDRPFSLNNTVRVGYDDNVNLDGKTAEAYYEDEIDLSFDAKLSPRTDLMVRSLFTISSDDNRQSVSPNIYAVLSHSVSPRLLLQFSEYYKTGDQKNSFAQERYDYFENTVGFDPIYQLTSKDLLKAPLSYTIRQHDKEIEYLDYTMISPGATWERTLSPQRTTASLNLRHNLVEYDKKLEVVGIRQYIGRDESYDSTDMTAGLKHTFNQEWSSHIESGVTYMQPDSRDYTDNPPGVLIRAENDSDFTPYFETGVAYTPSPRTRLTADIEYHLAPSTSADVLAQTFTELRLGAEHDFTSKITGKVTTRFADVESENHEEDTKTNDEYMDIAFLLTYKLNRVNFLEFRYNYGEKSGDGEEWDQNRVDVGWRVAL